ncbi:transposase [Streptomyces alanosinicus]|uniref:transposase n=1 Tax=Streptomyces alanosinicus TaxID=68171 RepID=UPI001E2C6B48|nr:transposase [Streptomyces alanosinicus]
MGTLIRPCSQLRPTPGSGPQAASRHTLRLLDKGILHLTEEINDLTERISTAINACAPKLLDLYGVGPDTALLTAAGDNPDRMAGEASSAALCGVSPVETSSGKTQRRRLNRDGDRRPIRRSTSSSSPAYEIGHPHPFLPGATRHRGPDTTRSHPMPQTLRRPRDPPSPPSIQEEIPGTSPCRLTSTGASNSRSATRRPSW